MPHDDKVIDLQAFRSSREERSENPLLTATPILELALHPLEEGDTHYPASFFFHKDLMDLPSAERLREAADMLEDTVSALRATAHETDPNEDGQVVAQITIYSSSRIETLFHPNLNDPEWLRRRLDQVLEKNFAECQPGTLPSDLEPSGAAAAAS